MAVDLARLFLGLQSQLESKLQTNREGIKHPGAKGEATELNWLDMLDSYLPKRYQVSKAFVIDADGNSSDYIDIVIFDRQYSPMLFNQDGVIYVPAESVYAVFEAKQEINTKNLTYAAEKAQSARKLRRTSANIPWAGGTIEPREHFPILAGILCLESSWRPALGDPFKSALSGLSEESRLDLGCVVRSGAFEVTRSANDPPHIDISTPTTALIFFFLRLLERLQERGTVPAIDLPEYGKSLPKLG